MPHCCCRYDADKGHSFRAASAVKKPADYHFMRAVVSVSAGSLELLQAPRHTPLPALSTAGESGLAATRESVRLAAPCTSLLYSAFQGLHVGVDMYEGSQKGSDIRLSLDVATMYVRERRRLTVGGFFVCVLESADGCTLVSLFPGLLKIA